MAFAPALLPGLIIGGLSGAASIAQARAQNKAVAASQAATNNAARVQQKQLKDAADLELLKNRNRAGQVLGRLRVAAGESGIGLGGSAAALRRQAFTDAELNQNIILQNLGNQDARVRSGAAAQLAQLQSNVTNPLLAGFSGGLGGFTTGLQIGQGIDEINRRNQTPVPDPYTTPTTPRL